MLMKFTKSLRRWVLAVFLLVATFMVVWRLPQLFYWDSVNTSGSLGFTENTYNMALKQGDVIRQPFIAQDDFLGSVELLIVQSQDGASGKLLLRVLSENGKTVFSKEVEITDKKSGIDVEIGVPLYKNKKYTMEITFGQTQGDFVGYFTPLKDIDDIYDSAEVAGVPAEAVLFAWYYYKCFSIADGLFLMFAFLIAEILLVLEWKGERKKHFVLPILGSVLCAVIMLHAVNRMAGVNSLQVYPKAWIVSLILVLAIIALISFIAGGRIQVGGIVGVVILYVYGMAAHYVLAFRGTPLLPADLLSTGTALYVAGNYDFTPDASVFLGTLLFALAFVISLNCKMKICLKGKFTVILKGGGIVLSALLCMVICTPKFIQELKLQPHYYGQLYGNQYYGPFFNFVTNIQGLFHKKPEDYSIETVRKIAERYPSDETSKISEDLPNVIVIMNEAWADLDICGNANLEETITPNIDRIANEKNAFEGQAAVSTFAGGTNKSEFEFLTGSSMSFDLSGACYVLDCEAGVTSLVTTMKELGYYTVALHPALAENYSRDVGYEKLGFDQFLSAENLGEYNFEYPRSYRYASDSSLYKVVFDLTKKANKENRPLFLFCITVQNHGDYSAPEYSGSVANDDETVAQYLSLLKLSDIAYEELVEYYRNDEKETMIFMFGDHMPGVDSINTFVPKNSLESYTTRFIFWANYDVDYSYTPAYSSLSYLQPALMRAAGLPLTGYQHFLEECALLYPIISLQNYYDHQMQRDILKDTGNPQIISEYKILQYNNLFGQGKRYMPLFSYSG